MPKRNPVVSDAQLLGAGVYDLDPSTRLLASQAGLLLGRSKTRMDSDRRDNKPPPPHKDRGAVWYALGGVLAERKRQEEKTLAEAKRERADAIRGWASPETFAGWLHTAGLRDPWPVATLHGCPVDALTSLGQPVSDIRWLTLGEYLQARMDAALARDRQEQEEALERAVGKGVERRPPL